MSSVAVAERRAPQAPRALTVRPESSRSAPARPEPVRPARQESSRSDAPRVDAPRVDAPRVDAPRVDAPRVMPPRVDAPRLSRRRRQARSAYDHKRPAALSRSDCQIRILQAFRRQRPLPAVRRLSRPSSDPSIGFKRSQLSGPSIGRLSGQYSRSVCAIPWQPRSIGRSSGCRQRRAPRCPYDGPRSNPSRRRQNQRFH